ncbi:MAG: ATP-dependent helicase HrpB, partial [Gammaproteobacteria bacterium]|nr:ATP-dependent helicase HrpB [Gammaproteobacteria bacterium]
DWLAGKQIIMLEPRRIAARNAAARMAFLLGENVGQTVGYQIRQDKKYSDETKILVVTEGILTRRLQADPELGKTALVIFDEFHERSIHADLSLALCLQSQQVLREDLKILVMSATLNTSAISELLDNASIIQSEGRSYPVEIQYLDKPIAVSSQRERLLALSKTINHVISHSANSCLVFLPGVREISRLHDQIKQYLDSAGINNILLAPLHGNLDRRQQDQAISPAPAGKRKIVLATNIAETSLTIEGINCVIDSGLERVLRYDPSCGMDRLITQFISQDSATQRSGRAGRLSAGSCYRLWTEQQQKKLLKHSIAEIQYSDLSPLILEICHWGASSPDELRWLDKPSAGSSAQAYDLLFKLQAVDAKNKITAHGKKLLSLGCHPRLAHMMLSAGEPGQAYHACLIASLLTEKDIYAANAEKTYDIHDRIKILTTIISKTSSRVPRSNNSDNIETQQCKRIIDTADEFYRRLKPYCHVSPAKAIAGNTGHRTHHNINAELTGILLAHAYPDRIAKQRNPAQSRYLLSNGKGANIPVFLQKQLYEYIVVANLDSKTSAQAKN